MLAAAVRGSISRGRRRRRVKLYKKSWQASWFPRTIDAADLAEARSANRQLQVSYDAGLNMLVTHAPGPGPTKNSPNTKTNPALTVAAQGATKAPGEVSHEPAGDHSEPCVPNRVQSVAQPAPCAMGQGTRSVVGDALERLGRVGADLSKMVRSCSQRSYDTGMWRVPAALSLTVAAIAVLLTADGQNLSSQAIMAMLKPLAFSAAYQAVKFGTVGTLCVVLRSLSHIISSPKTRVERYICQTLLFSFALLAGASGSANIWFMIGSAMLFPVIVQHVMSWLVQTPKAAIWLYGIVLTKTPVRVATLALHADVVASRCHNLAKIAFSRPQRVLMTTDGGAGRPIGRISMIKARCGVALAEELNRWLQAALIYLQANPRVHEAQLVEHLKQDLGMTHPVVAALDTVLTSGKAQPPRTLSA